jgi:large subunit ribosomal protein L2
MYSKLLAIVQKKLRVRVYNKGGRGHHGVITTYHRGSLRHRRIYRYINFLAPQNVEGVVLKILYDPNRTASIALLYYLSGFCGYTLAAEGLRVGSTIFSGFLPPKVEDAFAVGSTLPLRLLPIGFVVHNLEIAPGKGAKICRAAGSSAIILKKLSDRVLLKLRSGWNV